MENRQLVIKIDKIASEILRNGGNDEALLVGLIDCSDDFYRVMKTSSTVEMNMYCDEYSGFYAYAKTLELLAARLSEEKRQKQQAGENTKPGDKANILTLQQAMKDALLQISELVNLEDNDHSQLVPTINIFLLGIISTAADLVEVALPGSSAYLYAEIEAGAKNGGIRSIAKLVKDKAPHYSVSGLDEDDMETAMNYLGQQLAIALTKAMHELPHRLRSPETQLHGIEALLTNLLSQKFDDPHNILDTLNDHVHKGLNDLASSTKASKLH